MGSSREAILMERIEVLEDEVRVLRAVNKDVDAGMDKLRNLGIQADRTLMEVSAFFAYLLVTKHGGEMEYPTHSIEHWMDQSDSKVVVLLTKEPGTGMYKARAATREEANRVAGPRPT